MNKCTVSLSSLLCNESLDIPMKPGRIENKRRNLYKRIIKRSIIRKTYKSYTNKEKITYLDLAEKKGYKRAAEILKICWSTAKAWIKRHENFKMNNGSYIKYLICNYLTNYSARRKTKVRSWKKNHLWNSS